MATKMLPSFLCFALAVRTGATTGINETTFRIVNNTLLGLLSPYHNTIERSYLACATMCSMETDCGAFAWDSREQMCSLGRGVASNGLRKPNNAGSKLYAKSSPCRLDLGYKLIPSVSGLLCLHLYSSPLSDYDQASSICQADGGRLATTNSPTMWSAIFSHAIFKGVKGIFRIGVDDNFIWSDGQPRTPAKFDPLIKRFLINKANGKCAEVNVKDEKGEIFLDFQDCKTLKGFLCEIII